MGKKKVIQKSDEEVLKESDELDSVIKKAESQTARRGSSTGSIYIHASYNNTSITVTDAGGNVLAWSTAGSLGFAGPKKATPFAASKVAEAISEKMKKAGAMRVKVYVRGIGSGRDSAIRTLANKGFDVIAIKDVTPMPHNGPRPPKPRRI
jgi:small subunit ribosomal protein S11